MTERLIYMDNAATSFPKPPQVLAQMFEAYTRLGFSPGRGGYDQAVEAEAFVEETRQKTARFFGSPDPKRVIFTSNATDALNLALFGRLRPGDHVVSTRLEHNSVLRPLFHLKHQGVIDYDLAPFDGRGFVDPDDMARAIRGHTRLAIVCHASNVLGTVQNLPEIGRVCAERGVPLLIDAAQSAGQSPIRMTAWRVDAAAFTGHKALMGPSGVGGLVLGPGLDLEPTRFGGTGMNSESLVHTRTYPHRLEAGTLNMLGIIGLSAGLDYLARETTERIHNQEMALLKRLHNGLEALPGLVIYSPPPGDNRVPILTCNLERMSPSDVGTILDGDYGIAVRTGYHCAPLVHETLGTADRGGAVRFSLGPFNTAEDIDRAIEAMARLSGR